MRQFFVVLLALYSIHISAETNRDTNQFKKNGLEWLASLRGQGIEISASDWLILAQNPSRHQVSQLLDKYARYVDQGQFDKTLFQPGWHIRDKPEFESGNTSDVKSLAALSPELPQYKKLQQALAYLRDWQIKAASLFPDDLILFEGDEHPALIHLNQWLEDLDLATGLSEVAYTQKHKDVLTQVQLKFDLMPDGRLGAMTRRALLTINNERIRTLKANLERIRWLPKTLPYPHVKVDIAGFNVAHAVKPEETYIHKAIIGTRKKQTPVFQEEIEGITVNPVWKVPHAIAANSLLKIEKKKPGFFREEGFKVYESWDDTAKEVPPESVNWRKYTPRTFHHRLEQQPGELNRLGRIKLDLPNPYGVYLHDTDKPELFEKTRRSFSSGCTRVEGIATLVQRLAMSQGVMDELVERLSNPETTKVSLSQTIPVYFVYFTAWPDETGRVRFREDIYQLDNALTSWF